MTGTLTKRRKLGYASGIVSESVLYNMFYTYFLIFLTDIIGISPAIAGTVGMISIIVDGITDPMIGHIADRNGRDKRKLMILAVIPMAILFVLAFTRFNLSENMMIAYFISIAVLFWVAYTVYTVPYYAICAELTSDYDERTNIRGTSSFINAFAIFIGSAAPVLLVGIFENINLSTSTSWSLSAVAVGIIAIVFGFITYLSIRNIKLIKPDKKNEENIFKTYLEIIKIKPFKYLLGFVVLYMVQSSLAQANLIYLLKYRMMVDPDLYMSIALGAIVLGMVIFVPITTKLATIKDRRFAVITLLSIATAGMFIFRFIGITNVVSLVVMLLFYAIGLAVFWTTFYSFTYDIAELDEMLHDKRRVGAITSLPQLLQKFGAAIGIQTLGIVLAISGYDSTLTVQTERAIMGIEGVITILCPIVMALSIIFMVLYPITKKKYHSLQKALQAKKNGENYKEYELQGLL